MTGDIYINPPAPLVAPGALGLSFQDEFPSHWKAERFEVLDAGKGRVMLKSTAQKKVISGFVEQNSSCRFFGGKLMETGERIKKVSG